MWWKLALHPVWSICHSRNWQLAWQATTITTNVVSVFTNNYGQRVFFEVTSLKIFHKQEKARVSSVFCLLFKTRWQIWVTRFTFPPFVITQATTPWTSHLWHWQRRWGPLELCAKRPPSWPCGGRRRPPGRPPTGCCSRWCHPGRPRPSSALGEKQEDTTLTLGDASDPGSGVFF